MLFGHVVKHARRLAAARPKALLIIPFSYLYFTTPTSGEDSQDSSSATEILDEDAHHTSFEPDSSVETDNNTVVEDGNDFNTPIVYCKTVKILVRSRPRPRPRDDSIFATFWEEPRPPFSLQILNTIGGTRTKPYTLQHLSRLGTSQMVYEAAYRHGTAHMVGYRATAHLYPAEIILGRNLLSKLCMIWEYGIVKSFLDACGWTERPGMDID